jgi:hypothetical protein
MNRVNFANCSHVIVDVCQRHGTWFDKDELRRIIEFIREGGLVSARARDLAKLEQRQRDLRATQTAGSWDTSDTTLRSANYDIMDVGISAAAWVLKSLFR